MSNKQFKSVMAGMIVIFMFTLISTCNTCSVIRKNDELAASCDKLKRQADSTSNVQVKSMEVQINMVEPQVVNQFLQIFNSEKYKNEISLNNAKIDALRQQLKNEQNKHDGQKNR